MKKKIAKRAFALITALFGVLFAVAAGAFMREDIAAICSGRAFRKLPIYSVEREDKKISISFDCAWGNEYTEKLLDCMDEYGVKCTFFAVSFWIEKYPSDAKKIVERGHEMGTHSKTHSYMSKLSASEISEELDYSCAKIEEVCGKKTTLFRPPYGDYDDLLIETAEKAGLFTIQWSVDSLDWKNLSAADIAKRVVTKTKSGSIILCHNNGKHTAESLPLIFATLKSEGYEFVPTSELIYKSDYEIKPDGTQVKKDSVPRLNEKATLKTCNF